MREAAHGAWGRRELAAWLVCHYGSCVADRPDAPRTERLPRSVVVTESLQDIVSAARMRMVALLEDLRDRDAAEGITRSLIARGFVEGMRDEHGAVAYVPVDGSRMRLAERLASLFVADYLNAPFDYWRGRVATECMARRDSGFELVVDEPAPATLRMGIVAC